MKKIFYIAFLCVILAFGTENNASLESNASVETNSTKGILTSILKEEKTLDENALKESEENLSKEISARLENLDINESEGEAIASSIAKKVIEDSSPSSTFKKTDSMLDIVNQIKTLNLQIATLETNSDANKSKEEISTLKSSKNDTMDRVPNAIINQRLDRNAILAYFDKKEDIKTSLEKYSKNKQSFEYINAYLDSIEIEESEIFYFLMLKLEKMFANGTTQAELKKEISAATLALKTRSNAEIKDSISSLESKKKDELSKRLSNIENTKKVYDEILSFLSQNTAQLSSNIFFRTLNLKGMIDGINNISPFNSDAINLGKIIIIAFVTLFFYSFRRVLARVLYFIMRLFTKKDDDNKEAKDEAIDSIKKPIGVLLIAYSVEICAVVFYYPLPVPIKFGQYFSLTYIFLYAWLVIKIIENYGTIAVGKMAQKGGRKEVLNLLLQLLYFIVIIIAILLFLSKIGFNVSAILASLGIGGLAVALATKDIIANFFASVMLLFDNSFSQGDWIVAGGTEGTVVEIGLRKTTIRTFDNSLVFVPNSTIMSQNVKNWSRRKVGRQLLMYLGFDYSCNMKDIKKCVDDIKEMLMNHPGMSKPTDANTRSGIWKYRNNMVSIDDLAGYKNTLLVSIDEFAESSINVKIYSYTKGITQAEFAATKEDVMMKISEIMEANNVKFAFPSRSVYLELPDGSKKVEEIVDEFTKK
ncbi:MAG: mechanosensitive ion channel [Campylobacter sp.]|nr:mechanosensitive ion channel [Campylobacter sp.]